MPPNPLESQLAFLREIDRLKTVVRQSPLLDRSRKENSAEHSWHLAMYALILTEYAGGAVDVNRVTRMLPTPPTPVPPKNKGRKSAALAHLLPT